MATTDFQPCGVLALLSDFGTQDPYVGVLKGAVLARAPRTVLVDLTHEIPPQDVRRAAWFLMHSRAHFPAGTVFLCVVDPGVGSARALVLALDRGQAFLGPDNGLLAAALSDEAQVHELEPRPASFTFHGRDILAPAAGELLAGAPAERLGPRRARPLARIELARARRTAPDELAAEVLFADRYGNLILSAGERDLDGGAERWEVQLGAAALPLARTYSDALPGELVALVDSYAAVEIAVRDGSAAERLGLRPGAQLILRRRA
jgi:S-adenosylmethionine hydrolase